MLSLPKVSVTDIHRNLIVNYLKKKSTCKILAEKLLG